MKMGKLRKVENDREGKEMIEKIRSHAVGLHLVKKCEPFGHF